METHLIEYPKCGRTWVKSFIKRIIYNKTGNNVLQDLKVSHDGMTLYNRKGKYQRSGEYDVPGKINIIFLARNPKDVMVSFYYYAKYNRKAIKMNMDKFVKSKYGIDQMLMFYEDWSKIIEESPNKCLLVRYEDLKYNPEKYFNSILEFMKIEFDNKHFKEAIEYTRFDAMRQREVDVDKKNKKDKYRKIRKGVVGGYKYELSDKSIDLINSKMESYNNSIINYYKDNKR